MKNQIFNTPILFINILFISILITIPVNSAFGAIDDSDTSTSTPQTTSSTEQEVSTSTDDIIETPTTTEEIYEPISINFNLRYQDNFIFQGEVELSSSTTFDYTDSNTNEIFTTSSQNHNVLTTLLTENQNNASLNISNLVYYESFNSFLINCIEVNSSTEACYNWQYAVDGEYPNIGMDKYELFGGENVYVYFGNPWSITASTSTFPIGTTTTFQTFKYNFSTTSSEWSTDANDTIDISITNPNPTGWWDTTLTTTTLVSDTNGIVDFMFSATGTYYAKISPADFSKWSNAITINVLDLPIISTTTENNSSNGSSSSGSSDNNTPYTNLISPNQITNTANKLTEFLIKNQDKTGKIIDAGISDWSVMALVANGKNPANIIASSTSLSDYIKNYNYTDATDLNVCASYPRHYLSLYTSGISTNNQSMINLINTLKTECYSETDFGLPGINDDVFALFALLTSENNINENIITDILNDILADQNTDGAFTWDGYAGADITGAVINILNYAKEKGIQIDNSVFTKAKQYLKNEQNNDGGWGYLTSDTLTTSWVLMGLNSLGEGQEEWTIGDKNPWSVYIDNLQENGYYTSDWVDGVDWFNTKHAIPALLGYSWPIQPLFTPATANEQIPTTITNSSSSNSYSNIIGTDFNTTTESLFVTSTEVLVTSTIFVELIEENIEKNLPITKIDTVQNTTKETIITSTTQEITKENNITLVTDTNTMLNLVNNKPNETIEPIGETTEISELKYLEDDIINQANPISRNIIEKVIAVTGSGAIGLGLYMGLKFLKNII